MTAQGMAHDLTEGIEDRGFEWKVSSLEVAAFGIRAMDEGAIKIRARVDGAKKELEYEDTRGTSRPERDN